MAMSGLGALGRVGRGKKATGRISRGVRKVIAAFVGGRSRNNCAPTKTGGRRCTAISNGDSLELEGQRVATRRGSEITFCPADFPRTPQGRTAATALLRALHTGLRVAKASDGEDGVYSGRGGWTGVKTGSDCTAIPLTPQGIAAAARGAEADAKASASRAAAAAKREARKVAEQANRGEFVASRAVDGFRRKRRRSR